MGNPRARGAGVEYFGDVGVIHDRQRLPLGFETGDDLMRVHARLQNLEGDFAAHRLQGVISRKSFFRPRRRLAGAYSWLSRPECDLAGPDGISFTNMTRPRATLRCRFVSEEALGIVAVFWKDETAPACGPFMPK
jgi:hypothetical protein